VINGSDLRDFYIDCWRNVPELLAAMRSGDATWIRSSTGVATIAKSLQREVETMPEGSIFVAYQGVQPGRAGRGEVSVHEIAAFIRATSPDDDSHIPFAALMLDSIPTGGNSVINQPETKIRYLVPHIDADPMNMPRFERVSASQLPFDIWKLSFGVVENFS
jgi:hypothetical protein